MIRFAWLQFRTQVTVALGALVILGIGLAITGPHIVHLYNTNVATCAVHGDCSTVKTQFLRNDIQQRGLLLILVIVTPALLGIFWGAPLIARELETDTYRLVWTQTVSRTRWLAVKLLLVGLTATVVALLVSLTVTWWASPFDIVNANRFDSSVFDERGIVAAGYAAFAFVLGVTVGAVIRRTVPAMATALAAFIAARLAFTTSIRPHLAGAASTRLPVTAGTGLGFSPNGSGLMTFTAGAPSIPNVWVISARLVDNTGHAPTSTALNAFLRAACPSIANPSPAPSGVSRGPANQSAFHDCIVRISASYHLAVRYQPANRYWTFQWYEAAIFVGAALVLTGFLFWWVRRRLA